MLADILEIKVSVESPDEGRERDQEFGERGMNVHEECLLDVFPCESSEMNFIEPTRIQEASANFGESRVLMRRTRRSSAARSSSTSQQPQQPSTLQST